MADVTAAPSGGDRPSLGFEDTAQLPQITVDESSAERTAVLPPITDGYDQPPAPPAMPTAPPAPPAVPARPSSPPAMPSTGWTTMMPVLTAAQPAPVAAPAPVPPAAPAPVPSAVPAPAAPVSVPAPAPAPAPAGLRSMGGGLRGRILVVEGGYGSSGRRPWARGSSQAPVLSAMLAAVSPQILLAADAVDAVHLPGAADPQSVLAHLRAASRHPGPLLVHLGGHLITDRRGEQLFLTLRDSKAADSLPWQALAAELSHRPAEWDTLVIADLSADQAAWPLVQSAITPLVDGIPLWAVVSPDPEQIGTFTRALIEALHGGRPGAEAVLAPEQLRQQVHSVLRQDVVTLTAHAPDRPIFRNTSRQIGGGPAEPRPYEGPRPAAVMPKPKQKQKAAVRPDSRPAAPAAQRPAPAPAKDVVLPEQGGHDRVSLLKPGVPPTPQPPVHPVSLVKAGAEPEPHVADPADASASTPPAVILPKADTPEEWPVVDLVKADQLAQQPVPSDRPAVSLAKAETSAEPAVATDLPESVAPAARRGVALKKAKQPLVEDSEGSAVPGGVPAVDSVEADQAADQAEASAEEAVPGKTAAPEPQPEQPERTPEPEQSQPQTPAEPPADPPVDYREAIISIVRSADAGDHYTAAELAVALEEEAVAAHGPVAPAVLQVRQVRAHVSRLAGRPALAADLYREVALTLLRTHGPDHPETHQAATNAEACWRSIADPAEAIGVAPDIIELRAHLPGPDGRKLRAAERYLKQLAAARAEAAAEPEPTG